MKREGTLEEISDGRLYRKNDMVRAGCMDCKGCSDCCRGMGNTVQLDPLDIHRMSLGLSNTFEELVNTRKVELTVVDTIVLPSLSMSREDNACVFLNKQGRCRIHAFRPGICRLFPLGRYYEDGDFAYFLQVHECSMKNRTKVKVSKWVDTPEFSKYEDFVRKWHFLQKDVEQWLLDNGMENANQMSTTVLQFFYGNPYEEMAFYEDFAQREQKFRKAFSMAR